MEANHYEILKQSLAGARPTDEQTHESFAILNERLERLKKTNIAFENIGFSAHAKKMLKRKIHATVC